ncbi:MAG TPA: PilC/PilY family type IV pilus protein [Candidatus Baltobacteraceae bacterium]|nr:PilC/PilY family type IV pilus protein [Candidatus Baltobacteraceae bacterium]
MSIPRRCKPLALLLILALCPFRFPYVHADDSAIFSTSVPPNVMLFLDSSGSMGDLIPNGGNQPYSSSTSYSGSYSRNRVYYADAAHYGQQYTTRVTNVNSAAAQTALNTVGYFTGLINGTAVTLATGNWLNYTANPPQIEATKISIAQAVLTQLVQATPGVNFGLAIFTGNTANYGAGGHARILAPLSSDPSQVLTALASITPNGSTPLGAAMTDLGTYFAQGFGGFPRPTQQSCQPNYIIAMSDGQPNDYGDPHPTGSPVVSPAVATALKAQGIIVDTVGFAVAASEQTVTNATLQTIALNGGGQFYSATNESSLTASLQAAINRIMAATFSFVSPVVPSTQVNGSSRAYMAYFQSSPSSPFWRGYLRAYTRNANGVVPTDTNGLPLASALAWDAGQVLAAIPAANRTLYTVVGGSQQLFTASNAALTAALLGVTTDADRTMLIGYLRGTDTIDENQNGNTSEERAWKLGDIFHSTPVLVGAPPLASTDPTYTAFQTAHATRTPILLAGANDGMLHAFRESDGAELWGFIPPDLLGKLKLFLNPMNAHDFFVDGSPIAADVKIDGTWKTIVLFGERRGGGTYTALDITDPLQPQYLWSFTDATIAESWSEPVIGRIRMDAGTGQTDKTVAFLGAGYQSVQPNSAGKAVLAVDLATGQKLWAYSNDGSTDDRQYLNFSVAANPFAVDLDGDGYVDHLYIGDIGGQLWKFVLPPAQLSAGTSGTITNWRGKRFFVGDPAQRNPPRTGQYTPAQGIYAAPAVATDATQTLWIVFGTGDRNNPTILTSANRLYALKDVAPDDTANGAALTESALANATTTAAGTSGWYVPLAAGEKILAPVDIFNNLVYYTTFTPVASPTCLSGSGTASLGTVQLASGYAGLNFSQGTGTLQNNAGPTTLRETTIGSGIPSKPIIVMTDTGAAIATSVMASTTNQQLPSDAVPSPPSIKRLLYWRERF